MRGGDSSASQSYDDRVANEVPNTARDVIDPMDTDNNISTRARIDAKHAIQRRSITRSPTPRQKPIQPEQRAKRRRDESEQRTAQLSRSMSPVEQPVANDSPRRSHTPVRTAKEKVRKEKKDKKGKRSKGEKGEKREKRDKRRKDRHLEGLLFWLTRTERLQCLSALWRFCYGQVPLYQKYNVNMILPTWTDCADLKPPRFIGAVKTVHVRCTIVAFAVSANSCEAGWNIRLVFFCLLPYTDLVLLDPSVHDQPFAVWSFLTQPDYTVNGHDYLNICSQYQFHSINSPLYSEAVETSAVPRLSCRHVAFAITSFCLSQSTILYPQYFDMHTLIRTRKPPVLDCIISNNNLLIFTRRFERIPYEKSILDSYTFQWHSKARQTMSVWKFWCLCLHNSKVLVTVHLYHVSDNVWRRYKPKICRRLMLQRSYHSLHCLAVIDV